MSPKAVASAIGVSESSIKRWCDDGSIQTVRTAGGHRRLRFNSVFQFLREGGHKVIDPQSLGLTSSIGGGKFTLDEACQQFRESLIVGDETTARTILLDLYLSKYRVSVIADDVIACAFHEIGKLWDCGDVDIYQERRSCEICLNLLRDLRQCLPTPTDSARRAIGATVNGDPYSVAVTLGELVLRANGWDATLLGNSLPVEALSSAIYDCRPRLCWISVSFISDESRLVEDINSLFQSAAAVGTTLAIGGQALNKSIRRRLSYSTFCDTFKHLEQFAGAI